ncbi:MAG: MmgE/PrpD family protein [Desulfobacterales bacterium]|jgi:2-methylcitrate dehydratase PrpD|nr:MmgE/PrpD family protein [Desulfobacterales bacterium]
MEPTTVEQVARMACTLRAKDIPEAVLDHAAWCLLDLLGAAMAGFNQPSAQSARGFARCFFPSGSSDVWLTRDRLSPAGAAFCNAVAGSALDLDDGHRAAGGHPGASLIPAALAVGQFLNSGGRDTLAAVVIGYEVAVRAAAARNPATLDTFSTGRWCGFGAATVRCWLEKRGPEVLARAMAISGIHAPLQSASAYSRLGHHTKEGIPWGTLTGLAAVDLAAQGFVGPLDLWDHPNYYRSQVITDGFGEDWTILRTYFKPYACCRWLHAALDAWQTLVGQGLSPSEVERVEVFTFNRAINLNNHPDPASLEQSQFSLPFCLAVIALDGPQALLPLSADLLGRPQLAAFARKVSLHHDSAIEAEFPARAGARLVVHTAKGTFSQQVQHPRGDPANPLSAEELTSKFYRLAGMLAERKKAEAVVQAVLELRKTGVEGLFGALKELKGE